MNENSHRPRWQLLRQDFVPISGGACMSHHNTGIPQDNASAWHVEEHISTRPNQRLPSNCDISYQDRVRPDPYTVSYYRCALPRAGAGGTNGHTLRNITI